MRRSLMIILILPVLVFPFKDLPKSHWAYDEVTALAKLGIVSGYPDGTFRGNENVTRYQLAVTIYRTIVYIKDLVRSQLKVLYSYEKRLQEISDVSSKAYKWSSENSKVISRLGREIEELREKLESAENVKLLYNEVVSLKTEILEKMMRLDREYRQRISSIENRLEDLERRPVSKTEIMKEECDLEWVKEGIETLRSSISDLSEGVLSNLSELKEEIKSWKSEIKSLKLELDNTDKRLDLLEASVLKIPSLFEGKIENILRDMNSLEERCSGVEKIAKDYEILDSRVENISRRFDSISAELGSLRESFMSSLVEVRRRIENLELKFEDLEGVWSEIKSIDEEIAKLNGDVGVLKMKLVELEGKNEKHIKAVEKKIQEIGRRIEDSKDEMIKYTDKRFSECPNETLVKVALVFSVISTIISAIVLFISF